LVKNRQFVLTSPSFNALARGDPLKFGLIVISPETRMMGLPYGEESMIARRSNRVDTVHECDGQTDRITITKTVQRTVKRGKPN